MIARWATMLNVLPFCSHAGGYVATKERLPVFLVPDLTKVEVRRVWFVDRALLWALGAHRSHMLNAFHTKLVQLKPYVAVPVLAGPKQ